MTDSNPDLMTLIGGTVALVISALALYYLGASHTQPVAAHSSWVSWAWHKWAVPPLPLALCVISLSIVIRAGHVVFFK